MAEWCSWRAAKFSGRDVLAAYSMVMSMREAAVAASQPYDFLLSPTSPILAYEAELPAPGNDPRDALPHIAFTVPYNMSEQPAASINWTYSANGLPIGVQVISGHSDVAIGSRLARGAPRHCARRSARTPPDNSWQLTSSGMLRRAVANAAFASCVKSRSASFSPPTPHAGVISALHGRGRRP